MSRNNLTPRRSEKGQVYNGMQQAAVAEVVAKTPKKAPKQNIDADGWFVRTNIIQATMRPGAVVNGVTINKADAKIFISHEKGNLVKGYIFHEGFYGIQEVNRKDVQGLAEKTHRVSTKVLTPIQQAAEDALDLVHKTPSQMNYIAACEAIMAAATESFGLFKVTGDEKDLFTGTRILWKWYTLQRVVKVAGVTVATPKAEKDADEAEDLDDENEESDDDESDDE